MATPLTNGRVLPLTVSSLPSLLGSSQDVSGGAAPPHPAPAGSRSTVSTAPTPSASAVPVSAPLPASSVLPLFPYQFMLIIIIIIILICYHKRLRHRMFFLSPDSLGLQNPRLDSPAYGIGMSCQSLQSHQKRQSFGSHRKRGVGTCFLCQ